MARTWTAARVPGGQPAPRVPGGGPGYGPQQAAPPAHRRTGPHRRRTPRPTPALPSCPAHRRRRAAMRRYEPARRKPQVRALSCAGSASWRTRSPGERRVLVVRVVPRHQVRGVTRGPRHRTRHVEQRAQIAPRPRHHPGERSGARPARQPEQHRLGLVITGVPEEYGTRAQPRRSLVKSGISRSSAASSGPAPSVELTVTTSTARDRDHAAREPTGPPDAQTLLQAVVDRHAPPERRRLAVAAPRTRLPLRAPGSRRHRCRPPGRAHPRPRRPARGGPPAVPLLPEPAAHLTRAAPAGR